jgi:hypothetical protein
MPFFFFFFWSVWNNESQSAEAFQGHPLLLLVVGHILPGSFAQEEMLLCTNFKPVWDSDVTENNYPIPCLSAMGRIPTKTSSWIQSSGKDSSSKRVLLHVLSTSCFLSASGPNLSLSVKRRSWTNIALTAFNHLS